MKFFSCVHQFKFTWDQVAGCYWNRYPNPNSTHVLSEDVISRHIGKDGCLYSTRLVTKTNSLPKWGEKFVPGGTKHVHVIEESIINPKKKTMITYTKNIGLTKVMSIEERCEYCPSESNPAQTECQKSAWIDSGLPAVGFAISNFGYQRFKRNAAKASEGFEFVLNTFYGVTPEATARSAASKAVMLKKEKFKETAEKAKDLAKSKAAAVLVTKA
ncbi:hypothetical protein CAPTEDRAFT_165159 [Capitella teleta]|uniref:PRELI/MSF1 domain-containing protein n=1 Tax=Capitella teleta TaxID=283909 RepID=R7TQW5_CAPTE|nr:hypothetical protein CAPTEDRAFT_165159 [Capitella teleta]|eukprot:ELT93425.1 hypothetical protein CAPTEDRAFT_165159 [Capitella teleta]